MRNYRSAIIGLLVAATVAVAFIQIDDTNVQTILTGAIKTFQDEIRFRATGGGSEYVGLVAPSVVNTPSVTYRLPPNDGGPGDSIVTDGSANLSFATVGGSTPLPTSTPLVFGTPGVIAVFAATELGSYTGDACTPPALVEGINNDGSVACSTPVPAVIATPTPLIDLLYSGKLNFGANASGTPLGLVAISANATPAPHDRLIICTSGASAITYDMPPATASGRVLDVCKIDAGAGTCIEDGNSSETLNGAVTRTLSNQWDCDTCYDYVSGGWLCRGKGS